MKRKHRGIKRAMALLTAAIMLFSYALSNDMLMTAKADGTYSGPTVTADGVTFYYKDTTATEVWMKGSWDSSWGAHIPLTNDGSGNWSVTVPFSGDGVTGVAAKWGSATPGVASGDTTVTFERL